MAKQLRGGRQRVLGAWPCTAPAPDPQAAKHGGATEGSQTEERVLAKGGTEKERRGMEGEEWIRKKDEGRVEATNGEDMMVHKSPVADWVLWGAQTTLSSEY